MNILLCLEYVQHNVRDIDESWYTVGIASQGMQLDGLLSRSQNKVLPV